MKLFIHFKNEVFELKFRADYTVDKLYNLFHMKSSDIALLSNRFSNGQHVMLFPRLFGGGKGGGFIAQLKKEGAAMKRSDNKDKLRNIQNRSGKTEKLLKTLKDAQKEKPVVALEKRVKRAVKHPEPTLLIKNDTIESDREKQEMLLRKMFKKDLQ